MSNKLSEYTRSLEELLRGKNEKALLDNLDKDKLRLLAIIQESDKRWSTFFLLLLILKEIVEPIRLMILYPSSWTYKVALYGAHPLVLPTLFFVCGLMLLPLMLSSWSPYLAHNRRTSIGIAA